MARQLAWQEFFRLYQSSKDRALVVQRTSSFATELWAQRALDFLPDLLQRRCFRLISSGCRSEKMPNLPWCERVAKILTSKHIHLNGHILLCRICICWQYLHLSRLKTQLLGLFKNLWFDFWLDSLFKHIHQFENWFTLRCFRSNWFAKDRLRWCDLRKEHRASLTAGHQGELRRWTAGKLKFDTCHFYGLKPESQGMRKGQFGLLDLNSWDLGFLCSGCQWSAFKRSVLWSAERCRSHCTPKALAKTSDLIEIDQKFPRQSVGKWVTPGKPTGDV